MTSYFNFVHVIVAEMAMMPRVAEDFDIAPVAAKM
jgi:hypothetical protein